MTPYRPYLRDLLDRAARTAGQAAVLAVGAESLSANALAIDWTNVGGFALGGFVLSVLTTVAAKGITGRRAKAE
jgi:hypothetical protein